MVLLSEEPTVSFVTHSPLSRPLVINVAPAGMVAMRSDHPAVPEQPDQIADDVARCRGAGASSVHLHARDVDGQPTHRRDRYAEVIRAVRSVAPDLIICVSTSGRR